MQTFFEEPPTHDKNFSSVYFWFRHYFVRLRHTGTEFKKCILSYFETRKFCLIKRGYFKNGRNQLSSPITFPNTSEYGSRGLNLTYKMLKRGKSFSNRIFLKKNFENFFLLYKSEYPKSFEMTIFKMAITVILGCEQIAQSIYFLSASDSTTTTYVTFYC